MTEPGERAEEASLWRRWRSSAKPAAPLGLAEQALLVAAYVEGRLDEAQAEPVEDWLAGHPEALDDLIAARAAAALPLPDAPEALIARAAALVAPADPKVVSFPRAATRRPNWRSAMAWSGLAASLLVTGLFGFALGNDAYLNLTDDGQPAAESTIHQLLDPPSGLFPATDDEPAI